MYFVNDKKPKIFLKKSLNHNKVNCNCIEILYYLYSNLSAILTKKTKILFNIDNI